MAPLVSSSLISAFCFVIDVSSFGFGALSEGKFSKTLHVSKKNNNAHWMSESQDLSDESKCRLICQCCVFDLKKIPVTTLLAFLTYRLVADTAGIIMVNRKISCCNNIRQSIESTIHSRGTYQSPCWFCVDQGSAEIVLYILGNGIEAEGLRRKIFIFTVSG